MTKNLILFLQNIDHLRII